VAGPFTAASKIGTVAFDIIDGQLELVMGAGASNQNWTQTLGGQTLEQFVSKLTWDTVWPPPAAEFIDLPLFVFPYVLQH
jgi:hypothetical protein